MELHAVKGVGKDHAKFSPVGKFMDRIVRAALKGRLTLCIHSYRYISPPSPRQAKLSKARTSGAREKVCELFQPRSH